MVARVSGFGFIVITQLFVGHLGELSLAAYAIQQTVFLRFTNGILDVIQLASAWIQSLIPSSGFVFQKALKLSVASHSFSSLQRCWILPKRGNTYCLGSVFDYCSSFFYLVWM
ncbi:protein DETOXIFICATION 20-like isoform X5 [Euphorbia lathyris]|uniref:protein DETOXIFICATION 20-like isoform X5 n=1 Tax=Euphorbia lathyris TaxID=212925 RepID=UPI0033144A9E